MSEDSINISERVIIDVLLVILFFVAPAWIVFITSFILAFLLRPFFEFLILSFFLDLFYGAPMEQFFQFSFIYTLLSVVGFSIAAFVGERIRYDR